VTLIERKSRMPQIQGVTKGEAVVYYCKPLTRLPKSCTADRQRSRWGMIGLSASGGLSRKVNKMRLIYCNISRSLKHYENLTVLEIYYTN
jgi:hypothetical protein